MASRNNSVSTTTSSATNASSSTAATSISAQWSEDRNTILSDFNPTVVLYTPPRGSLPSSRNTIPIHDLSPYIKVLDRENITKKQLRALHATKPWEKDGQLLFTLVHTIPTVPHFPEPCSHLFPHSCRTGYSSTVDRSSTDTAGAPSPRSSTGHLVWSSSNGTPHRNSMFSLNSAPKLL